MIDKKIDEKETQQLKKIYNHYLDKRSEILKNTQFKVKNMCDDVIYKDYSSKEQTTNIKCLTNLIIFQQKLCQYKYNF